MTLPEIVFIYKKEPNELRGLLLKEKSQAILLAILLSTVKSAM